MLQTVRNPEEAFKVHPRLLSFPGRILRRSLSFNVAISQLWSAQSMRTFSPTAAGVEAYDSPRIAFRPLGKRLSRRDTATRSLCTRLSSLGCIGVPTESNDRRRMSVAIYGESRRELPSRQIGRLFPTDFCSDV